MQIIFDLICFLASFSTRNKGDDFLSPAFWTNLHLTRSKHCIPRTEHCSSRLWDLFGLFQCFAHLHILSLMFWSLVACRIGLCLRRITLLKELESSYCIFKLFPMFIHLQMCFYRNTIHKSLSHRLYLLRMTEWDGRNLQSAKKACATGREHQKGPLL